MKKLFLLGAMVCALGMMTACKSGEFPNKQEAKNIDKTLLFGEWDAVWWDFKSNCPGTKDWSAKPAFNWRIWIYDDGHYDDIFPEETLSSKYHLSNDTLLTDSEPCGGDAECNWWIIDTLSTDKMVLVSKDSSDECTATSTVTFVRIK